MRINTIILRHTIIYHLCFHSKEANKGCFLPNEEVNLEKKTKIQKSGDLTEERNLQHVREGKFQGDHCPWRIEINYIRLGHFDSR